MRKELRTRIGEVMRVPQRDQEHLDCIESDGLFIVFKPSGGIKRDDFNDLRALLRQAIVAGAAALETYVADIAMVFVGPALKSETPPTKLKGIPLTVGQWHDIEHSYERRAWGIREVVENHIREVSSPAPGQVGWVLGSVGVRDWSKRVDAERGVQNGTTVSDLQRIAARRNRIAHTGDRVGQGRACIDADEVDMELRTIRSIVEAIDALMAARSL